MVLEGVPHTVGAALSAIPPAVRDRVLDEQGRVRLHVNVFVGSDSIRDARGLDTPLAEGAEVYIIPAVSGGAGRAAPPKALASE